MTFSAGVGPLPGKNAPVRAYPVRQVGLPAGAIDSIDRIAGGSTACRLDDIYNFAPRNFRYIFGARPIGWPPFCIPCGPKTPPGRMPAMNRAGIPNEGEYD